MPVEVKVKLEGMADIARALRQLPPELSDKALTKSVRDEVRTWRDAAKAAAPVAAQERKRRGKRGSVTVKPGTLKRSVRMVKLRQPAYEKGNSARYGVRIAKRAFYWQFSEFGTSRQPAKPFVRPVFDRMARPGLDRVARNARQWLERYWKRQAKR